MRARRPFVCSRPVLVRTVALRMYFRRLTTSLTVAAQDPRMSRMISMNLPKDSGFGTPSSASPSKMRSAQSTRPATSTPTSWSAFVAAAFSRRRPNSALEIWQSPSTSSLRTMSSSFVLTRFTASSSFSTAATLLTTSQRTPMSMFMTVRAPRRMKIKKMSAIGTLSLTMSSIRTPTLSSKVPRRRSVYMECRIEEKYLVPTSRPAVS
mmetsp:Transcript_2492/g.6334  ORF Transcript_2492/g.6334 Transcript_2492/m.6334 type:complete len:208 (-) Transcript_2492:783-1406(-)